MLKFLICGNKIKFDLTFPLTAMSTNTPLRSCNSSMLVSSFDLVQSKDPVSSYLSPKLHPMCSFQDTNNNCTSSNRTHCSQSINSTSSLAFHQNSCYQQRHFFQHHPSSSRKDQTLLLIFFLVCLLVFSSIPGTVGIDCFKCVSLKGDNPSCEDPFHNNYSVSILESPCMGGRKGRNGLFPATACIKLAGKYSDTGESMVVRTCAVDSGTLTLDTELARMSHCGFFYFDDRYVKGCLQSCDDADGCNGSSRLNHITTTTIITAILVVFLISSITTTMITNELPAYFFLPNLLVRRLHYGDDVVGVL